MDNNLGHDNEDDDHLINHHHLTALPECTTRTTAALIKESNDPIIQLEYVTPIYPFPESFRSAMTLSIALCPRINTAIHPLKMMMRSRRKTKEEEEEEVVPSHHPSIYPEPQ